MLTQRRCTSCSCHNWWSVLESQWDWLMGSGEKGMPTSGSAEKHNKDDRKMQICNRCVDQEVVCCQTRQTQRSTGSMMWCGRWCESNWWQRDNGVTVRIGAICDSCLLKIRFVTVCGSEIGEWSKGRFRLATCHVVTRRPSCLLSSN